MVEEIINWIKEYFINSGVKGVVIGNSGGKDSATVIALLTKALGKEKVLPVVIPCHSKEDDMKDAEKLAKTFGLENLILDITNVYDSLENSATDSNINLNDEAKINIKPRLRMTLLYAIAQTKGYLVAGTGNMCEQYVGYTTKWGDNASDFNPIANLTVDEVIEVGMALGVPEEIINKPPHDGLGGLTDEEKMGITYNEIAEVIKTGTTKNKESLRKIQEMHRKTEHKRNSIPSYKPIERKL